MCGYQYAHYEPPANVKEIPDPRFNHLTDEQIMHWRYKFIFEAPAVFEPVTRDQVVGMDHILKEVDVYIKSLRNYQALSENKAELDTGALFYGAPGSGKTYMARHVATESGARFINVNDFPRKKMDAKALGIMLSLMQQYVEQKKQPIVAFWDEFDAFAEVGDDEDKKEALSRFKIELSGVNGNLQGIFIIAATNKAHVIPADVIRPGRLGKKIYFGPLTRRAKKLVFEHYVRKFQFSEEIDFESMSYLLSANFPAEIEDLVKSAWRLETIMAADSGREPKMSSETLARALIKLARSSTDDIVLTDEAMRNIAIYEIGRALVARTFKHPLQLIAIQKEGYGDSFRIERDDNDPGHRPLSVMKDEIAIAYGGIVAQEMFEIEVNTKYVNDFSVITATAQSFVEQYRAAKTGTVSISILAGTRNQQALPAVDARGAQIMNETISEMEQILAQQKSRVEAIFKHYGKDLIERMAKCLIEKGFLLQMDIDAVLDPEFHLPIEPKEKEEKKIGFKK